MITTLIFTDGRDELLKQCITSLDQHVSFPQEDRRVIVDDTGEAAHWDYLQKVYPRCIVLPHLKKIGFCRTISTAWQWVLNSSIWTEYVFHVEDDFIFQRPVSLGDLIEVLDKNQDVAQLALKRQPVNNTEVEAQDLYRARPGQWEQKKTGEHYWLKHRNFFTTNPSLYPFSILQHIKLWEACECEGRFGIYLQTFGLSFGYWGTLEDPPWVLHSGLLRKGTGY